MSTRIKGKALMLELEGQDYWADLTSAVIKNEEADEDTVTFEDAAQAGGARKWLMELAAIQSTDPTSFWSLAWDQTGEEVPYIYAPHGNETPTAAKPHFTGQLTIGPPPDLGGEAGRTNTYTFETVFELSAKPVKDTGV